MVYLYGSFGMSGVGGSVGTGESKLVHLASEIEMKEIYIGLWFSNYWT